VTALVPLAAENPLIPPIPELVIGLIAFAIVFGFLAKKLLRTSTRFWKSAGGDRSGMEKADAAQAEAQETLEQYRDQLAEARHEAARLRQSAGAGRRAHRGDAGRRPASARGDRYGGHARSRPTARPRPPRCVMTSAARHRTGRQAGR